MHINLLCACWYLEAMKGSSSLTTCRLLILSRLSSSLVWAQLTLLVPALGIRSPPSPKWRLHSQGPRTLPYRDPEQVAGIDLIQLNQQQEEVSCTVSTN
jgi:hypothetical protein